MNDLFSSVFRANNTIHNSSNIRLHGQLNNSLTHIPRQNTSFNSPTFNIFSNLIHTRIHTDSRTNHNISQELNTITQLTRRRNYFPRWRSPISVNAFIEQTSYEEGNGSIIPPRDSIYNAYVSEPILRIHLEPQVNITTEETANTDNDADTDDEVSSIGTNETLRVNSRETFGELYSNVTDEEDPNQNLLFGPDSFFQTVIRSNDNSNNIMRINNLSSNSPDNNGQPATRFYTLFEYEQYRFRFNHDAMLNPNEADYVLQSILSSLYQNDIDAVQNQTFQDATASGQGEYENSITEQEQIKLMMIDDQYINVKKILRNDTCPISMEEFHNDDIISYFAGCHHGILQEYKTKFVTLFRKCPLCNMKLI